jgi:hypothetical protein
MTGAYLSLVPREREPQPRRRYETRIVVSSARTPIGRSQVFNLSERNVEQLIDVALRLERRP